MPIKMSEQQEFTPVESGIHNARFFAVVDIGTQDEQYLGEAKKIHKIAFAFEFSELLEIEGNRVGEPRIIWVEYTASLGDKANLRKQLGSLFGKEIKTKEDAQKVTEGLPNLAKKTRACRLNILHKSTKDGKIFAKIETILPLDPKFKYPPTKREPIYFSLDPGEFDSKVLDLLPKKMQEKIKKSPEFAALSDEHHGEEPQEDPQPDDGAPPF